MASATALEDARERFPVGSTAIYWLAGRVIGRGRVTADPWEHDGLVYVPLQKNNGDDDDYPAPSLTALLGEVGPPPSQEPEEVARLARGLREDLVHLEDDHSRPAERNSATANRRASIIA